VIFLNARVARKAASGVRRRVKWSAPGPLHLQAGSARTAQGRAHAKTDVRIDLIC